MGPEDFGKFAETLSHVAKLYGVRLTDEKVSLFFDACRSLSPEQFAVGIKRHVKRGKFFPSPSELFEALFGTEEDQAMLAWCDVLRAVRACGSGGPVRFCDLRIHFVIESMGGWVHVASAIEKGEKWVMKDFKNGYVFALKKGVDEDGVKPYLLGDRGLPYGARQEDLSRLIWEIPACDGEGLYRLCVVERSSGTASPV